MRSRKHEELMSGIRILQEKVNNLQDFLFEKLVTPKFKEGDKVKWYSDFRGIWLEGKIISFYQKGYYDSGQNYRVSYMYKVLYVTDKEADTFNLFESWLKKA